MSELDLMPSQAQRVISKSTKKLVIVEVGEAFEVTAQAIGLPNGAVSMWWVPIPESQLGPKAWSGKLLPSPPNSQDGFPRSKTSSSQRSQAMKTMKKKQSTTAYT